jgi:hypothetical protein
MGVGWPPSSFSLGRREGVAFLGATGGCLRDIPFFKCVFTNHGQGLSTFLTLFHPLVMFFKEKE